MTKSIFLHTSNEVLIGKGMSQSISSNLVINSHGPLNDDHFAIEIVETFDELHIPLD